MSDPIESREEAELGAETPMLSRRRALGLGAAVAGGVWAAPMILSFDAASATASGGDPTTTTEPGPTTTAPASTTTAPATTTTTAAPRTITASVTGSVSGISNPAPITVPVGEPINLVFTRTGRQGSIYIGNTTVNGTATAGVDYTAVPNYSYVVMGPSESTKTITIQTTATGAGPNTAFSLRIEDPS